MTSYPSPFIIYYFIQDSLRRRQSSEPDIQIQWPHRLRLKSLHLRDLIEESLDHQADRIALQTDESKDIDDYAIRYVVYGLQIDGMVDGFEYLERLARICNVLWEYKCIPDSFTGLWDQLKYNQERSTDPHAREQISSDRTQLASDSGSQITVSTSDIPERIWRSRRWSISCCHRLLRVALVLKLDDLLRAEIVTAVWASRKDPQLPDAMIDLLVIPDRREAAMKRLFNFVKDALVEIGDIPATEKWVKNIRREAMQKGLGDLTRGFSKQDPRLKQLKESPYDWIQSFEELDWILGRKIKRHTSASSSSSRHGGKAGGSELRSLWSRGYSSAHIRNCDELLGKIQRDFVEAQDELVQDLWVARHQRIQEWKTTLAGEIWNAYDPMKRFSIMSAPKVELPGDMYMPKQVMIEYR